MIYRCSSASPAKSTNAKAWSTTLAAASATFTKISPSPNSLELLTMLAEHSQIVYIETDAADQQQLVERAQADPKPMYYRPSFLQAQLQQYLELKQIEYSAQIEPDDFLRWIFPQLYQERLPRYAAIAQQYGRSLPASSIAAVTCAQDFYDLLN